MTSYGVLPSIEMFLGYRGIVATQQGAEAVGQRGIHNGFVRAWTSRYEGRIGTFDETIAGFIPGLSTYAAAVSIGYVDLPNINDDLNGCVASGFRDGMGILTQFDTSNCGFRRWRYFRRDDFQPQRCRNLSSGRRRYSSQLMWTIKTRTQAMSIANDVRDEIKAAKKLRIGWA